MLAEDEDEIFTPTTILEAVEDPEGVELAEPLAEDVDEALLPVLTLTDGVEVAVVVDVDVLVDVLVDVPVDVLVAVPVDVLVAVLVDVPVDVLVLVELDEGIAEFEGEGDDTTNFGGTKLIGSKPRTTRFV